jgi:hypothetical protein
MTRIDLTQDVARGGAFAPLRDSKIFNRIELDQRRRVVQWLDPNDGSTLVDIDADALFVLSEQQRAGSVIQRVLHWFRESHQQPVGHPTR